MGVLAKGLNRCMKVAFVAIANRHQVRFLSELSFTDGEEKLNTIAFYFMKMR